jgi:hypothetical protein
VGLAPLRIYGGVEAKLVIGVRKIDSVAHQAARLRELAPYINSGHRVAGRQRDDLRSLAREESGRR